MTKRVFNFKKFILFLLCLIIMFFGSMIGTYFFLLTSPSNESNQVTIYVDKGSTYSSIVDLLLENNLIRSKYAYKIYLKLNEPDNQLEYGNYVLKTNYDVSELINTLGKGSVSLADTVSVTFIEGKNMRHFMKKVSDNFNISEDEILDKLNNEDYIDTLINDYWFLTDEIKNEEIYYPLEGYLAPNTYEFYKSCDIDDIFRKLLDQTGKILEPFKDKILSGNRTIHQMITLASIVELEGVNDDDRKSISGVFYNRLKDNWSLGSDPTTYYAEKIDDNIRDLKMSELNSCNAYNTRSSCMSGKLPVGPICNPSVGSLIAGLEPTNHNYYYFVADKNGKNYFNETQSGHDQTINKLKRDGLWITY